MDLRIAGHVALITGAARGIGRAEAEALAAEGVHIALNDIDEAAAADTAAAIAGAHGVRVEPIIADVMDDGAVERMVRTAHDRFGGLHILVNNAGLAGRHMGHRVEDMAVEHWDAIYASHSRATFLCCHHAIPRMKQAGYGRIINTSSMNYTGGGRPGVTNYASTKAAIAGFTRTLAKEVAGYGITANALAPGYVETALIANYSAHNLSVMRTQNPLKRLIQPEEVGAAVAYLCSWQARAINGIVLQIDGGKQDYFWE